LTNRSFQVFYSKELVQEYQDVIGRPKFRIVVSDTQALRFQSLALSKLKEAKITTAIDMSRDPNDNYLLAMAIDTNADYLVTGDDDLLALKRIGRTRIVKMSEFQAIL
jgi:putative PIN family toxin of toxin-antitoxin system